MEPPFTNKPSCCLVDHAPHAQGFRFDRVPHPSSCRQTCREACASVTAISRTGSKRPNGEVRVSSQHVEKIPDFQSERHFSTKVKRHFRALPALGVTEFTFQPVSVLSVICRASGRRLPCYFWHDFRENCPRAVSHEGRWPGFLVTATFDPPGFFCYE